MHNKTVCKICNKPRASFICATCHKTICIMCVYVTVVKGIWNFYCSMSCAPYIVDSYNKGVEEKEERRSA